MTTCRKRNHTCRALAACSRRSSGFVVTFFFRVAVSPTRLSVPVIALFTLTACEPRYVYTDCLLPSLTTDLPIRTLINVGDPEDRTSDKCTVPTPRSFEATRSYGTIRFEWWGSPHRLYIAASATEGRAMEIRGDGIEPYENTTGSWLAQYAYRKTFPVENLILSRSPAPERFAIEIMGADGQPLDSIEATYQTVTCSCAVPEGLSQ